MRKLVCGQDPDLDWISRRDLMAVLSQLSVTVSMSLRTRSNSSLFRGLSRAAQREQSTAVLQFIKLLIILSTSASSGLGSTSRDTRCPLSQKHGAH